MLFAKNKKRHISPFTKTLKTKGVNGYGIKNNNKITLTITSIMQHELQSVWRTNQVLIWTVDPEIWAHY